MMELLGPFLAAKRVRKARAALKRHLDTFDDLRDTHVQLVAVERMLPVFPEARQFHDYLCRREDRFRRRTRKKIKRVRTKRLAALIAACRRDVRKWRRDRPAQPANALLLRSIDAAFARTQQLKERIEPEDTRTIHCARVAFKRFRYMVETLADRLPAANEKLLEAMRRYQTMMGEIPDAEVLLRSFEKFRQKKGAASGASRRLREELLRRRAWLIRVYLDAADQLLDFWPAGVLPGGTARSDGSTLSTKRARGAGTPRSDNTKTHKDS
jgi:CHAD domain-containing protein